MSYHEPVLLRESVDGLKIKPDGVYVDVTFGGGGHSAEILKRLNREGKLIAFDQDPDARKNIPNDERFTFIPQNFRYMQKWLSVTGHSSVNGILADLGVSSHQFDTAVRGFSLRHNAPLDMRMDQDQTLTASKVLNEMDEKEIVRILRNYGEVENALKITRAIIQARPVETSGDLISAIERFAPRGREHKFYAQVFQALRIEVNDEMGALKELLNQAISAISPKGRLVVISYHSLEDRLVKNFMRSGNEEGRQQKDFYGNIIRPFKPVNTKPSVPGGSEIEKNNRARSAKLRIAERTEN